MRENLENIHPEPSLVWSEIQDYESVKRVAHDILNDKISFYNLRSAHDAINKSGLPEDKKEDLRKELGMPKLKQN